MNMIYISLALVLLAALIITTVKIYNDLIKVSEQVRNAFANIGVVLKQRHDEIPKLVDACQKYMQYEQETLSQVIAARNKLSQAFEGGQVAKMNEAEQQLSKHLKGLMALAENYPELKSSELFLQIQQRVSEIEHHLADKRELYNDAANRNNIKIQQFPDLLLAKLFSFESQELLIFPETELADVNVGQLFQS